MIGIFTNFVIMDLIAQIRMGTSLCPGLCPWGHGGIGDVSALHYWYMRDGSDGFQKKADEQISVSEQENSQVRFFLINLPHKVKMQYTVHNTTNWTKNASPSRESLKNGRTDISQSTNLPREICETF